MYQYEAEPTWFFCYSPFKLPIIKSENTQSNARVEIAPTFIIRMHYELQALLVVLPIESEQVENVEGIPLPFPEVIIKKAFAAGRWR